MTAWTRVEKALQELVAAADAVSRQRVPIPATPTPRAAADQYVEASSGSSPTRLTLEQVGAANLSAYLHELSRLVAASKDVRRTFTLASPLPRLPRWPRFPSGGTWYRRLCAVHQTRISGGLGYISFLLAVPPSTD
jgi:hypothetical protein